MNDNKRDTSSLWKIINKIIYLKNVKKNNIPNKMCAFKSESAQGPQAISNLFNKYQRWSRGHKARGQGQGPRTQPQVFSKNNAFKKSFSGNIQFIDVAKIFNWRGLNHKSHAMTSSKICLLALNQDFAKGEGLN